MTLQFHPIRRLFSRFFPRKYLSNQGELKSRQLQFSQEERKEEALHYLVQGELALLKGNLQALSLFETAAQLDPENPKIWYRQGLAFFEYGSEEGKEKSLLVAAKYFKIATQFDPSYFQAYVAWGDALLQLGKFHSEYHFLLEAKEKYEKAKEIALQNSELYSAEEFAELSWNFGILWSEIANHSGEACDLSLAIDAFQKAKESFSSPELLSDCGKAYLEMGLLINDSRLYLRAIEYLQKAVEMAPHYFDGWIALGESYTQLYLNTMDERYVTKASHAYGEAIQLSPQDADAWISWGELLGESGMSSKDPKTLRLSIEKCARAAAIDPQSSSAIVQWVQSLSYLGALTARLDLLVEAEQKILKATDTFPDDPDLWLSYGICLMGFGKYYEDPEFYELAIEKLQWGLSMDRTSAEHWHALGLVHLDLAKITDQKEILERACRFLVRAIDLKPSYPALIFDTASAHLHLSQMTGNLSSLEESIRYFEQLLQAHKESLLYHPGWLFEYAQALQWLGDFSSEENHYIKAIEIFSHVLLIHPDFPSIHRHIAICYLELGHLCLDTEFYKKSIHFFRLASRNDEENDQIYLDWGICLIYLAENTQDLDIAQQLYFDAEQKISKAGMLGNSYAYYSLACLYSILGKTDEAMKRIYQALDSKALPTLDEMAEDEWLCNLRSTSEFLRFFSDLEAKLHEGREE